MSEFVIRLNGRQEQIVNDLVNEGYFNTKSEAIRAGLLELYNKYMNEPTKEEVELVRKATKHEMDNIISKKEKTYTLEEMEKKYGVRN